MKIGDREYRMIEASDYPMLQLGKLTAVFIPQDKPFPAKFLGTGFETFGTGWQVTGSASGKDELRYGDARIYVDVTPRKRYVIWSNKYQRFAVGSSFPNSGYYDNKLEAQLWIDDMIKRHGSDLKKFSVVEFNVPEVDNA